MCLPCIHSRTRIHTRALSLCFALQHIAAKLKEESLVRLQVCVCVSACECICDFLFFFESDPAWKGLKWSRWCVSLSLLRLCVCICVCVCTCARAGGERTQSREAPAVENRGRGGSPQGREQNPRHSAHTTDTTGVCMCVADGVRWRSLPGACGGACRP